MKALAELFKTQIPLFWHLRVFVFVFLVHFQSLHIKDWGWKLPLLKTNFLQSSLRMSFIAD